MLSDIRRGSRIRVVACNTVTALLSAAVSFLSRDRFEPLGKTVFGIYHDRVLPSSRPRALASFVKRRKVRR